jgi:hypothetical protein
LKSNLRKIRIGDYERIWSLKKIKIYKNSLMNKDDILERKFEFYKNRLKNL